MRQIVAIHPRRRRAFLLAGGTARIAEFTIKKDAGDQRPELSIHDRQRLVGAIGLEQLLRDVSAPANTAERPTGLAI